MIKTNLPVLILRGIVLLPNNDIRLEFDNSLSKSIIDVSELFHESNILVVSNPDLMEENPNINSLPKIGVISKISHRIELPNGKTRVVITGLTRAKVYEYLNVNREMETIESIVSTIEQVHLDELEESILRKKVTRELETFIKNVPTMSNSVLGTIATIKTLSNFTDVIAPFLPISLDRLYDYLKENDPKKRCEYLLSDIYNESEMFEIEKEIDQKVKHSIDDTQKEFILREKIRVMKEELGETSSKDEEVLNIRNKIEELDLNSNIKSRIELELKKYDSLPVSSPEMGIVKNYIDWVLSLPWNIYTKDEKDLKKVRKKLDESHYGLEKIKERIIEYLAVNQMTKSLKSPIICLVGPPGVGKTSLAFSIANSINRNFVKMSVGGINDEAEIIGHRRTYLGANPGRIIQSLKKAKSSNPVFLIDEIDKMTKDIKGDPASALLEVLDPEQNKYFSDNYIEEEYDLSKVMFIATANYIENIPSALKDRLEIIDLNGYTEYEKLDICKTHIIKKQLKEHGILDNIDFKDDAILTIIRNYTREAGVRELERKIATIIRKVVTSFVVDKTKIDNLIIDISSLEKYLGKPRYHSSNQNTKEEVGIVNGLAYTSFGGDTLPIEVNYFKGKGDLVLTGSLGDVMKESAKIAFDYIKANYKKYDIDYDKIINNDIHIHVPEGAIPKDGPSAGIALTTALISALNGKKIPLNYAMTGEITLRGKVLPIGGLKEKSIGAYRNNIEKIIIPSENSSDLDDIPSEIKEKVKYIMVNDYDEVYNLLLETR